MVKAAGVDNRDQAMKRRALFGSLVVYILATAGLAPAGLAQGGGTKPGRILNSGTVVRATTDTNQVTGELVASFRLNDTGGMFIIPCSSCAVAQYPVAAIRRLDMRVSSSRASHIGVGALIGTGIGGAVGAILGGTAKIEGSSLGAPAAVLGGAILGAMGGILGAAVGAVLPTNHWEQVLPPR